MPTRQLVSESGLTTVNVMFPWYSYWARREPSHPALVTATCSLSYGRLHRCMCLESERLRAHDVLPGTELVLDILPGAAEWLVGLLAALAAGARVILPDPEWLGPMREQCLARLNPVGVLQVGSGLQLRVIRSQGAQVGCEADPSPGVWLFTSGTTADPQPRLRPLILLHKMVKRVRERLPKELALGRPTGLCVLPLYHGFGLLNSLFLTHAIGGTVVVQNGSDPVGVVRLLEETAAQVLYAWPSHFKMLADPTLWRKSMKCGLRWCVSSSKRLDPLIARRFAQYCGCPVRQQYGLTETGPLCLDSEQPPVALPDCVGTPLRGVEVAIVDDSNEPLLPGEEGNLAVKFEDARALSLTPTTEALWRPGDIGRRDELGRVFVSSRLQPFSDERREG